MENRKVQEKEIELVFEKKKIWGWLWQPDEERAEKLPAVILSHGYNGSGTDFEDECRYFASNGYLALAIDFCGGSVRSKSSGSTLEMSLRTEMEDLQDVLEYVRNMPQVCADQVFLFGGSQGGVVSALTAAADTVGICGLVMYYPALCIPDNWNEEFPKGTTIPEEHEFWGMTLGRSYFEEARSLDVYKEISGYGGKVLIVHGDEDEIVDLSYSERAQEIYEKARLLVLPKEKHGFSINGKEEAQEAALCFMEQCRK